MIQVNRLISWLETSDDLRFQYVDMLLRRQYGMYLLDDRLLASLEVTSQTNVSGG